MIWLVITAIGVLAVLCLVMALLASLDSKREKNQ